MVITICLFVKCNITLIKYCIYENIINTINYLVYLYKMSNSSRLTKISGYIRSNIYNKTVGYFYTYKIMKKVFESLPDDSKILDVGIGTGYTYSKNSKLIKQKNFSIVGVDIDPEYIRSAKCAISESNIEKNVKLVLQDIYTVSSDSKDIPLNSFDYVIFSDSYAVIPNVHDMITFCERFLKLDNLSARMVVVSTLFDKYNDRISWIKNRLIYVTTVDFGSMMLKSDLKKYVRSRTNDETEGEFDTVEEKTIPGEIALNTYIVKWYPVHVNQFIMTYIC